MRQLLHFRTFFIGFVVLLALSVTSLSFAQEGVKIEEIVVDGNQRVEKATIRSFLSINPGDTINSSNIDNALAKSFETGLFADINIRIDGNILRVNVVENPIIVEVAFEGNKRVDDDALRAETTLSPRSVYNKTDLQNDVKRILNIYQKNGRFSAEVTPKVIQLSQNRVNLVFEIDEGQESHIAKISFVGNNAFNDNKLLQTIQTKETRWYRFLSSDDKYDPDRLAFDQELLRRFYISKGYADFRVLSSQAELTPEKDAFFITFTLEEGPIYTFDAMSVESQLPDLDDETLSSLVVSQAETIFNAEDVDKTIDELTKALGNLGYAFVNIEPQYKRDLENKRISVNYLIKEGPRVYVDRIDIKGNVRTMDEVIRREFRLAEGDPYNADKLKRSQQRIRNLGFFTNVDINNEPGDAADKVSINVDVEEQSTGELTFGAGFSSTDGALGNVSVSERNLLGRGQFLRLNFTLASARQEIDLSFTEPHFLDRDIAAGFDIFRITRDGDSAVTNRTFDNDTIGSVFRATYPITEHLRHSVRYSFRSDDIRNVDENASEFIKRQEGKNSTSLVGHSIIYDALDDRLSPSDGYLVRFNQDIAGLGGESRFLRNELRASYYQPLIGKDLVLKLEGNAGHIFGFAGKDVRINDRFFLGSNDIRGFANDGVGPRDEDSLDPLGGNIYLSSTTELSFPLGLPEELGFTGSVFSDIGTLFETDDEDIVLPGGDVSRLFDRSSPRASVGVGVSWKSPLGPIRIDYAEPVLKEDFDELERFKFSFGTRF